MLTQKVVMSYFIVVGLAVGVAIGWQFHRLWGGTTDCSEEASDVAALVAGMRDVDAQLADAKLHLSALEHAAVCVGQSKRALLEVLQERGIKRVPALRALLSEAEITCIAKRVTKED